ncbi:serine hydrolase [Streptomyces sp. NPDC058892]|uniref:serine hydrolase n=1 Tax=unclassified Streptomyces TaxID=2593676 RepID=UPI00368D6F0E
MTELNTSFAWSAGGMVSTAGDLNRFFAALLGGRLLPPAQQEEMFAVRPAPAGQWIPGASYGLGMSSMALSCGATVWGMGGAINGSYCYTYGTRDGGHLLAQSVNGDWNDPIGLFTQVLEAELAGDRTA